MRPAANQNRTFPLTQTRGRGSAFLVVAIASFIAALGANLTLPAWQRSQRLAKAQATAAQLKQFVTAFQNFAHEHGDWPPSSNAAGGIPAGMEKSLSAAWQQRSPIGGRYVWLTNAMERGERVQAAIVIASAGADRVSTDPAQLDELLRQASDERLRLGFQNQPVLVLEH